MEVLLSSVSRGKVLSLPPQRALPAYSPGEAVTSQSRAHIIASELLASPKEKGQNAEVPGVGFLGHLKGLTDKKSAGLGTKIPGDSWRQQGEREGSQVRILNSRPRSAVFRLCNLGQVSHPTLSLRVHISMKRRF